MVDEKDVERVADNARLNLDDEEKSRFAEEFEKILDTFKSLARVDTEDTEPSFHPVDVDSKSREDEAEESLDKEQVFQNTENEEDGHFKGPSA